MKAIDYLYYRISLLEFASDGKFSSRGNVYVSFLISMFASTSCFALGDFCFGSPWMFKRSDAVGVLAVIVFGAACVFFFKRYDRIYPSLEARWSSESWRKRLLKGIICLFSFPLAFLPLLLYFGVIKGFVKH